MLNEHLEHLAHLERTIAPRFTDRDDKGWGTLRSSLRDFSYFEILTRDCVLGYVQPELSKLVQQLLAGVGLQPTVVGSGRVPHVRPSVHGPKTGSSNAFTPCAGTLDVDGSLFTIRKSIRRGCAPSSSAHVRSGEHGAPVQGTGIRSLLHLGDAVKLHQACYPNPISGPQARGPVFLIKL